MVRYGARVYQLDYEKILIKQTIQKETLGEYVVDVMDKGKHRESHIPINDDHAIAEAVRTALRGELLVS
ncbi:MAG: hypothetical protein ACRKGH_03815 [Dehalogenimonas sp.]